MIQILIDIQEFKFLCGSENGVFNFNQPFPKKVVFRVIADKAKVVILHVSVGHVRKDLSFFL